MLRSYLLGLCVLSAVCYCSIFSPATQNKCPLLKSASIIFDEFDDDDDYHPVEAKNIDPFKTIIWKIGVEFRLRRDEMLNGGEAIGHLHGLHNDLEKIVWIEFFTKITKINKKLFPSCYGRVIAQCKKDDKYRNFDGSCNNLEHPGWGVPNSTYSRLLPPAYADGLRQPRRSTDKSPLPWARKVRTKLFPTGQVENNKWSLSIMSWGQFLAHDMSLLKDLDGETRCCTGDGQCQNNVSRFCYPIRIPRSDPTWGEAGIRCMNFSRTLTDKDMGCSVGNAPVQQLNRVTAYIDLSNVYGPTDEIARSLRTLTDGEMKTEKMGNKVFPPNEPNKAKYCRCNAAKENVCFKTGDSRSNQNPQLTIHQIMFVREHNRLAKELKDINPHWDDERLFQEARRINIAVFQHITYYEWMPILLNNTNLSNNQIIFPDVQGFVNDYDSTKVPDVSNEHATAAFRQFHTNIAGMLQLMNGERQRQSSIPINDWLNRPQILENGIEQLTVGLVSQPMEDSDNVFVKQITDNLFVCTSGIDFGKDLKAMDIQRDRDHALGYYNDYRKFCGLKTAQSWEDYGDYIKPKYIAKLKKLYKSYKDVDLSVGGGLETNIVEAEVGPTFLCILNEQFRRTRQADRFWFENLSSRFTLEQLYEIRKSSSSRFFCDNGDGITKIQPSSFVLISPGINEPIPCSGITAMNLTKWMEK